MKEFHISRRQAKQIAEDLNEYANMKDSSKREIFKGFEIRFGDLLANGIDDSMDIEITPIPDYLLIEKGEEE